MTAPRDATLATALTVALGLTFGAACSTSGSPKANTSRPSGASQSTPSSAPRPTAALSTDPERSIGCADANAVPSGEQLIHTTSSGMARTYLRFVPHDYRRGTPIPLVVDFHGYLEGAQLQSRLSGLGPFGDAHGFVTVTPQGSGTAVALWNTLATSDDMKYVGHLLDEVEAHLCIDTKRVYATGLSNGAMMTSAVACVYANRFAAVAPVSGIQTAATCTPGRAVPVVAFHGTADQYLSYNGGLGSSGLALPAPDGSNRTLADVGPPPGWVIPSVPAAAAAWATRNGCPQAAPHDERVATDVTRRAFECPTNEAVELYTIAGGGHTWPGSPVAATLARLVGRTSMSISADAIIWAFFQAHPLP